MIRQYTTMNNETQPESMPETNGIGIKTNTNTTLHCRVTPNVYIRNESGLYVCPHCGETKNRQNTMYYHIKKHIGVTDHKCLEPGCGKEFIQKSGLDQHRIQSHPTDSVQLWSCGFCTHSTKSRANLMIHIGRCHSNGWIPKQLESHTCSGCNRRFISDTAYFYHAVGCFASCATDEIKIGLVTSKCYSDCIVTR